MIFFAAPKISLIHFAHLSQSQSKIPGIFVGWHKITFLASSSSRNESAGFIFSFVRCCFALLCRQLEAPSRRAWMTFTNPLMITQRLSKPFFSFSPFIYEVFHVSASPYKFSGLVKNVKIFVPNNNSALVVNNWRRLIWPFFVLVAKDTKSGLVKIRSLLNLPLFFFLL